MQEDKGKLVSVIMPIYNAEEFLNETLDMVTNQTLKDIEIICVDDGSSDGSLDILQKFASDDERMTIIQQKNQYAGVARNNGLVKATGKYVVFWDSDDLFELEALATMYHRIEEDAADICVCGANQLDNNTQELIVRSIYLNEAYLPENRPFAKADMPENIFRFATNVPWNKMFRRDFLIENKLQFQDIKQANDTYFTIMALFYAKRITYVTDKLITYRLDNDSSLTGKASDTAMCAYDSYVKTREALLKEADFVASEELQRGFANRAFQGFLFSLFSQSNIESYNKLYQRIADEGLRKFELVDKEEDYFIPPMHYERKQMFLTMSPDSFLLTVLKATQRSARNLRSRNAIKAQKIQDKKEQIKEQRATIIEQRRTIREQEVIIDSFAVRTALKTKKILTINGKLRFKRSKS